MTNPTPAPPEDYPHEQWADDGDYYVPEDLRNYYADAEPSDQSIRGYVEYGSTITEPVTLDVPRAVGKYGDVTTEPLHTYRLRSLDGHAGYQRWLHMQRTEIANRNKQNADRQRAAEEWWQTCVVCGTRSVDVSTLEVWRLCSLSPPAVPNAGQVVKSCPRCRPLLTIRLRDRLVELDAATELEDGRTLGDAADQAVDKILTGGTR